MGLGFWLVQAGLYAILFIVLAWLGGLYRAAVFVPVFAVIQVAHYEFDVNWSLLVAVVAPPLLAALLLVGRFDARRSEYDG